MIKEFTIPRKLWGKGAMLRADSGKMCCLGHLGKACGVPVDEMAGTGFPSWKHREMYPDGFKAVALGHERDVATEQSKIAAVINDGNLPYAEKESKLIALFASEGITLMFDGEFDGD